MITRFAPSPTGPLHLGHAYSAMLAHDMAMDAGGMFLLRIEDIDQSRGRPEWETQIYDDLRWLGLWWPEPVMRQSQRQAAYDAALDTLWDRNLLFPCTCRRKDILAAASAPQEGAPMGPDGVIYPGTCRGPTPTHYPGNAPARPRDQVLRLNASYLPHVFEHRIDSANPDWTWVAGFTEIGQGRREFTEHQYRTNIGDVVLARRDMGTSYHLSVVVDDFAQGITHVVRGQDLQDATPIHVVLQKLLGYPTPIYHHHRLIRDDTGKRLAKRDDARALSKYRSEGATPADIRRLVGLPPRL